MGIKIGIPRALLYYDYFLFGALSLKDWREITCRRKQTRKY